MRQRWRYGRHLRRPCRVCSPALCAMVHRCAVVALLRERHRLRVGRLSGVRRREVRCRRRRPDRLGGAGTPRARAVPGASRRDPSARLPRSPRAIRPRRKHRPVRAHQAQKLRDPSLGHDGASGPRRPPHLVRQRIRFAFRKLFRPLERPPRPFGSEPIQRVAPRAGSKMPTRKIRSTPTRSSAVESTGVASR